MKLFGVLVVLLGFATSFLSAKQLDDSEKVYISKTYVALADDHIQVWWNDEWIFLPEIYSDAKGLFIKLFGFYGTNWICPYCRFNNDSDNKVCEQCGRPRPTEWFCSKCGHKNSPLVLKCTRCGKRKDS